MKNWYLIFCLALLSCHERNNNKVSPAELMKSREIRKVSEAEILQKGSQLGKETLALLLSVVSKRFGNDTLSCDMSQWTELDTLGAGHEMDINQINEKTAGLTELELQLLSAYQYNLENQIVPTSAVQKLDDKTVLFVYPISAESDIYQYCLDSMSRQAAHLWRFKIPIKAIISQL